MSRCVLFLLACWICPGVAAAYQLDLELEPGRPPVPIPLPDGAAVDDLHLRPLRVEIEPRDPTPQPAGRTVYVAGSPVEVPAPAVADPVRARVVELFGRTVVLVEARPRTDAGRVERVTLRVVIGDESSPAPPPPVPAGWRPALPEPPPVLAVVTTARIVERSQELARWVRWREAGGYTVIVGTEQQWDRPETGDHRVDRIRAWLRQLHGDQGLGFVLLVGSPEPRSGSVPMQLTHPMSELVPYLPPTLLEALDPVPTDHWYADLDGDWDLDGDGRLAEFPDDDGPGGVQWEPDVVVGRLPVYGDDVQRLDQVLAAIIDYETGAEASRRRVLLPAAFIGFAGSPAPGGGQYEETNDGAVAAETVVDVVRELDPTAELVRLYEEDGLIPSTLEHERRLDAETLLDEWSRGAGLVVAYGHGSTQADWRTAWLDDLDGDGSPSTSELLQASFFSSDQVAALAGVEPALTFHAACENGWPEDPRNLAATLLGQGAVGSVAASRAAVGGEADFQPAPELGDADTMAYTFVHLLLEGVAVGQVMAYLRYGLPADGWGSESGIPLGGYGWLGKLEFNLYGDPLVRLGRCQSDADCEDGSLCNGEARCLEGSCVQGELVDCSHLDDICAVGRCLPDTGECEAAPRPDGVRCDDELFCTADDACVDGVCLGVDRQCGAAPEGFRSVCDESERRCLLEAELVETPDAGADAGADGGSPAVDARGGGCSAWPRRPDSRLLELLTGLF